jgi:hypothetical protein
MCGPSYLLLTLQSLSPDPEMYTRQTMMGMFNSFACSAKWESGSPLSMLYQLNSGAYSVANHTSFLPLFGCTFCCQFAVSVGMSPRDTCLRCEIACVSIVRRRVLAKRMIQVSTVSEDGHPVGLLLSCALTRKGGAGALHLCHSVHFESDHLFWTRAHLETTEVGNAWKNQWKPFHDGCSAVAVEIGGA